MNSLFEVVNVLGEVVIIVTGIWLTIKNKSKSQQLKDSEEKNKRLRIEVVIQEEKVEDLEQELKYQQEIHATYVTKNEDAVERSRKVKSKINTIRTEDKFKKFRRSKPVLKNR